MGRILNKQLTYITIAFFLLFLPGCFTPATKWDRKGISSDQWVLDKVACQSQAKNLMEKDLRLKTYSEDGERNALVGGFYAQMKAYDLNKEQNQLFHLCLRRLGYTPTPLK